MGSDVEDGVCDSYGRVFRKGGSFYAGLHVLDGSLHRNAVGVNPSHTIAALAERGIQHAIEHEFGDTDWAAPETEDARRWTDLQDIAWGIQVGPFAVS